MGLVKSAWMEEQERGWVEVDTFVCADCVEDSYLKDLIKADLTSTTCDYCGRSSQEDIAASANIVLEAVFNAVWTYYCEPASAGVPYDGGFIVEPIDIGNVLLHLGFDAHPDFFDEVVAAEANGNFFVPAADGHWASCHDHEVMLYGWQGFAHTVKHKARFHFASSPSSPASGPFDIEVADMLPALAKRLRPLIRTVPAGTTVYRVRVRKRGESWLPTADQLGAPPPQVTTAGRMNPAGISYLYTSFDADTARCEVRMAKRTSHSVYAASFRLTQDIQVVDLTQLPALPSLFDVDQKQAREEALFIQDFVKSISVPVAKDGREHIDYVPTQVVCEYLAQVFEPSSGSRLAGIIFSSSVRDNGKNLVVFPEDHYQRTFHGVEFVESWRHRYK